MHVFGKIQRCIPIARPLGIGQIANTGFYFYVQGKVIRTVRMTRSVASSM